MTAPDLPPAASPPASSGVAGASGGAGFPKSARLLTGGQFQRVQKAGRAIDLGPLVFRVAPHDPALPWTQAPTGRLGLAISKRVGNAVARNRVKRLSRESFRKRKGAFATFDVVVTGRPAAAELDQPAVDKLFDACLARLPRR